MIPNRIKQATATTGTGSVTLGAADSGYATVAGNIPDGTETPYTITEGATWETGYGTVSSSGTILSRTLLDSSSGSLISLAGAAKVMVGHHRGTLATARKVKRSNTARASTTTTAADPDLAVALGIATWRVRFKAAIDTNATADYKWSPGFTGTATVPWLHRRHTVSAGLASGTDNESTISTNALPADSPQTGTTAGIAIVEVECVLIVTAAGSFQFKWAQSTSDVGNTTCLAGSWIEWEKV